MKRKRGFLYLIFIFSLLSSRYLIPQDEKVIAEIGEYKITIDEFEKEIRKFGKSQDLKDRLNTLTDEGKKKILEQIIREKLFFIDAEKEGIKLTPDEEDNLLKLRTYMIINKYISEKLKEKPITEEEMKNYYEKNKEKFVIPEKRKLSHIIVKEEKEAKELLEKIKKGDPFSKIAKEKNIDGTKEKGGDLGWVSKNYFIKEFEEVAFKLNKGEISDIVKTKFGYHIIKVEDIKPQEQRNFENVKEDIRRKLIEERIKQIEDDLKRKYNVKINYDVLNSSKKD